MGGSRDGGHRPTHRREARQLLCFGHVSALRCGKAPGFLGWLKPSSLNGLAAEEHCRTIVESHASIDTGLG